jgi:hypothetical protein
MNQFQLYFQLGMEHIADLNAFDHILFILALCVIYQWNDWKKIIILVTAFTVGHSITLALATLDLIRFDEAMIEFLIPITIMITAAYNILRPTPPSKGMNINYLFALFFGLIHGMGFSNYLRSLLGKEASIFQPLLAFNLGLEAGQLIIVLIYVVVAALLVQIFKLKRRDLTLVISSIVLGMAFMLLL